MISKKNRTSLNAEGLAQLRFRPAGAGEFYVTAATRKKGVNAREEAKDAYQQIGAFLAETGATIVQERIYGDLSAEGEVREGRATSLAFHGITDLPVVTYVEGKPLSGSGFAGVQMFTVTPGGSGGAKVSTFSWEGQPRGRLLEYPGVRYVYLSGLHGDPTVSPSDQVGQMFESADKMLRSLGGSFHDVVRTWIYLTDILDWYGEFNAARNEQFRKSGLLGGTGSGFLPASTGIGGRNSEGASCVCDLLAILKGDRPGLTFCTLSNPSQNEALEYRSAFSRGLWVKDEETVRVYASGCAAIDEHGQSLCPDDPACQIERTLKNVDALLRQSGLRLRDMVEATAFFKRPCDARLFTALAEKYGLSDVPLVCTAADVCRPELLFEMDGLAVTKA